MKMSASKSSERKNSSVEISIERDSDNEETNVIFRELTPEQVITQEQIKKLIKGGGNPNEEEKQYDKILEKIDYEEIEMLLLARSPDGDKENLLEKKLKEPQENNLDNLLRKLCIENGMETFYTKKMLSMKNPIGKYLIHYVIESKNDSRLITFLLASACTYNKQTPLMIISEQMREKTGKTIFQNMYEILNEDKLITRCIIVLEQLLIEMKEIEDIQLECDIETVLNIKSNCKVDILRVLIKYWNINSSNYEYYKNQIILNDPFCELIFMLKEKRIESFQEKFATFDKNVETFDANSLLFLALKTGQKPAMVSIVQHLAMTNSKISFPTDKLYNTSKDKNFLMKLLLEHGFNVHSFVNPEEFEDSLDDRINQKYQNEIIIDYKSFYDGSGSTEANLDNIVSTCKKIFDTHSLKNNMIHPVLSIIINLNALKFQTFHELNCLFFIAIYMVPFYILLYFLNELHSGWFWVFYVLCSIGTLFLIIRETFQFNFSGTRNYFKNLSNIIEMFLIVLSMVILVLILVPEGMKFREDLIIGLSSPMLLLATLEALLLIPFPSITIYMLMFKNVALTFCSFLLIFSFIIITFALNFCIVMKPVVVVDEHVNLLSNDTFNLTKLELETMIANIMKTSNDEDNVNHNFENIFSSLLKTLLMLSGEFTIEPFSLENISQMILFFCFVITSLFLFNFILGLVIDDIQNVRKQADFLLLQYQMENSIQTSKVKVKFQEYIKSKKFIQPFVQKMMDKLFKDSNMQTIKHISIDLAEREVFVIHNWQGYSKKVKILTRKLLFSSEAYKLDKDTVDKLKDIVIKNRVKNDDGCIYSWFVNPVQQLWWELKQNGIN